MALLLVSFAAILACAIAAGELLELIERSDGSTAFDSSITSWVVAHRTEGLTTLAHALSTIGSQVVLTPVAIVAGAVLLAKRHFVLAGLLIAGELSLVWLLFAVLFLPFRLIGRMFRRHPSTEEDVEAAESETDHE